LADLKKFSSSETVWPNKPKLSRNIYGQSSLKIAHLSRSVNKHDRHRQLLFLIDWFFLNSPPLKPFGQMNRNWVGSIYGRSSIKITHFVPIG
jgi:hypothetical protein